MNDMSHEFSPTRVLKELAIERVIWIDDMFDHSVPHLHDAILRRPALVKQLKSFDSAAELLNEDGEPFSDSAFADAVSSCLAELDENALSDVDQRVRARAASDARSDDASDAPSEDLKIETARTVCQLLAIDENDRLGFEDGRGLMNQLSRAGADSKSLAIIVDMQDAAQSGTGDEEAGIGLLKNIGDNHRGAMVFVLTQETGEHSESRTERLIWEQLDGNTKIFHSVISKERLLGGGENEIANSLKVALKRSALRREVDIIAENAQQSIVKRLNRVRERMYDVKPEELDKTFINKAVEEGVSELHLLERLLSGQSADALRQMFAENTEGRRRVNVLRAIQLADEANGEAEIIDQFRADEIWDEQEFLQAANAPIAVGDVFETTSDEYGHIKFVVLGQPCDVTLRKDGTHNSPFCTLVRFEEIEGREAQNSTVQTARKRIDLPVGENKAYYRFKFNHVSPAVLGLLDLASVHPEGQVKVDSEANYDMNRTFLEGQRKRIAKARRLVEEVKNKVAASDAEGYRKAFQKSRLTLRDDSSFRGVCVPKFSQENGVAYLDWGLKRTRRLRSPWIDVLLDQHVALLSRRALELDY